jgi:hypothetical protein
MALDFLTKSQALNFDHVVRVNYVGPGREVEITLSSGGDPLKIPVDQLLPIARVKLGVDEKGMPVIAPPSLFADRDEPPETDE